MKKRILLLFPLLIVLLLSACTPPPDYITFTMNHLPENPEVFVLLPDESGDSYTRFEKEKTKLNGAMLESAKLTDGYRFMLLVGYDKADVRNFCETFRSCRLEVNGIQSQVFSLVPEDKFGYPDEITYDVKTDTFTAQHWISKKLFGFWAEEEVSQFSVIGFFGLLIALLIVIILKIVSVAKIESVSWTAIWIVSITCCLPGLIVTGWDIFSTINPYYNMKGNSFTAKQLLTVLHNNGLWLGYLFILLIVFLAGRYKKKKASQE